ncbi:YndM family protein [Paenibacillus sp. P25]|nr:YndM family protein [Paenibacillus sp. P25]
MKLLVKLILNGVVMIPMLYMLSDASVTQILIASVVLSVLAYYIGDQWILRETNNTVATIADFGLAGIYLWAVGTLFNWRLSFTEILLTAVVLAVVEVLYHGLLKNWDREKTTFSNR